MSQSQARVPALTSDSPLYLKYLRTVCFNICQYQNRKNPPKLGEGSWARQAFELGLFRIFSPEASSNIGAQISDREYPRVLYPFEGVNGTVSQGLKKIIDDSKKSFFNIEENLRFFLWDRLFNQMFNGNPQISYEAQSQLKRISSNYPNERIDVDVQVSALQNVDIYCPILLVQVSREPLHSELAHKDELKLSVAMAASLLRLIDACKRTKRNIDLSELCVHGLLIGCSDFQILTMIPHFESVEGKTTFSMVLVTSRTCLRFRLFNENEPATLNDNNQFFCHKNENFECEMVSAELINSDYVVSEISNTNYLAFSMFAASISLFSPPVQNAPVEFEPSLLPRAAKSAAEALLKSRIDASVETDTGERKSENFIVPKPGAKISFKDKYENLKALEVLEIFGKIVLAGAKKISDALGSAPILEDGSDSDSDDVNFTFVGPVTQVWPEGLPTQYPTTKSGTCSKSPPRSGNRDDIELFQILPIHKSASKESVPTSSRIWTDELGHPLVDVCKLNSAHEMKILQNPIISRSPYFPKLLKCEIRGETLLLRFEAAVPFDKFIEYFSIYDSPKRPLGLLISKFILDLLAALNTLHEAGYIHSDISPRNVGYNEATGTWQLFDFDCAMPISESLKCPRRGGTKGFVSHFSQETGIFRPRDDYLSLFCTAYYGFSKLLEYELTEPIMTFLNPITSLVEESSSRSDIDFPLVYSKANQLYSRQLNLLQ